jgi:hypothetical protein
MSLPHRHAVAPDDDFMRGEPCATQNEAQDLPVEVIAELQQQLGDPIRVTPTNSRPRLNSHWICTGSDSRRIFVKRFGTPHAAREALVYERVLRRCKLPVPTFRSNLMADGSTWLLIDFVERAPPVCEGELLSLLARALATLHNNSLALDLLVRELRVPEVNDRYRMACERSLRYLTAMRDSERFGSSSRTLSRRLCELANWSSEAVWISSYQPGLVHGNVHLGNVIVAERGDDCPPGISLLDWADTGMGSPLEDLGTLVADVPGRLSLVRDSYSNAGGYPFDMSALTRAFHFQLFVEVAWHAFLAVTTSDPYELRLFHARASLFGL